MVRQFTQGSYEELKAIWTDGMPTWDWSTGMERGP